MELVVLCYHFRYEVAVIVDDRHFLCALVIQFAGIVVCEHEVLIDEFPVDKAFDVLFYF